MGPASRAAASSSSASVGNASRKNHRSKSSNNNSGGNNNASVRNTAEMTDVEYLDYIGNYKPGTLRTIKLTNFLTHKDVVIRPGPR